VLFLLHYDEHRVVATPHFSARRVQRRGRRSRGDSSPGGVSHLTISAPYKSMSNKCTSSLVNHMVLFMIVSKRRLGYPSMLISLIRTGREWCSGSGRS